MKVALLSIDDLHVRIGAGTRSVHAVRGVSLAVERGETLSIVGESGCGKSMTAAAIMGLLPAGAARTVGRLTLGDVDLAALSEWDMADVRGRRISIILQDPMTALNPAFTIGNQLEEVFLRHRRGSSSAARAHAIDLLTRVGVANVTSRLRQFPHQLSGGLRQRVMIAMALMCEPELIIADEATTALDVTIQAQILQLLGELRREFNLSLLLITHDMGVVARIADRVAVMYAGEFVETGAVDEVFARPAHPYTKGLLDAIPSRHAPGARLKAIAGAVPSLAREIVGCAFRNRCPNATEACAVGAIPLTHATPDRAWRCLFPLNAPIDIAAVPIDHAASVRARGAPAGPIIEARNVSVVFKVPRRPFAAKARLQAVSDFNIAVAAGETLAIVGESGSGKTTVAMTLLNIQRPTTGEILFKGQPLASIGRRDFARQVQPVFQDPYSSLNPNRSVLDTIAQPLAIHGIGGAADRRRQALDMMDRVRLLRRHADAEPHQLSGGQRQRVAIARALVAKPEILICDEPTSALDVSVQAQILNLLDDLRRELSLTYILITHNLAIVEHMASRVVVMYLGRVVEEAPAREFFSRPKHPYSIALLKSVLTPEPRLGLPDLDLRAAFPDPLNPPSGCHFHPRCNRAFFPCASVAPKASTVEGPGFVRCHLFDDAFSVEAEATVH